MTDINPKEILDTYLPLVIRKDRVFVKENGDAGVDTSNPEKYSPENYSENIALQIMPKDSIVMEFEDTPEHNRRIISEAEEACRVLGLEYCVTGHNGKSDYIRIYNIKGIPVNEDNKLAKELLMANILSDAGKKQLDKTNYGWTYSPVIGHPHWKPKYNGQKHEMLRGIPPLEQKNTYPKELLKSIIKMKKIAKEGAIDILKTHSWVNDFLIDHCCNHKLPQGSRHVTIVKNFAALIYHRADRDKLREDFLRAQGMETDEVRGWLNAISNGKYDSVSPAELKKFIEDYQVNYIPPKISKEEAPRKLTEEEIEVLKDPMLLLKTVELIQKVGVIGEEDTIFALINKAMLRLVRNHKPTSSNVVVSDLSGSGKDAITGAVTKVIIHPDDLLHRTRFSDRALEYFMIGKGEDYTLNGKLIYLEDPEDDLIKGQAFRVMASGNAKVTVVKDQEILELSVKGKPVIIVTSLNATIDQEGERRWDSVRTDTSVELTELIKKQKAFLASGEKKPNEQPLLSKALQKLQPQEVVIPYAECLVEVVKSNALIMRTQIDKLFDYIKASAVLHQFQREKDELGRIKANAFDYEYARCVFKTLGDMEGGMLNVVERALIEILRENGEPMSFSEIINTRKFPRAKTWLYENTPDLIARNIVGETDVFDEKANRMIGKLFSILGHASVNLPSSDEIKKQQEANRLHFLHFRSIPVDSEDHQQITFPAFPTGGQQEGPFFESVRGVNKNRAKLGLKPLFMPKNEHGLSQTKNGNAKSLRELSLPEMQEMQNIQQECETKKDAKNERKTTGNTGNVICPTGETDSQSLIEKKDENSLVDRIKNLREYCQKLLGGGITNSYENLCWNYGKEFIDHCIAEKILYKLPNGSFSAN